MLKIITITGIVLVVAVAAVLVYAAMQPDTFRIARAATIMAPPEKIYPLMSDFRRGMEWSPYEKKDPGMKRRFSGPVNGKGAVYEFEGNGQIGAGRLEIAEATPPQKVVLKLDMIRPFHANNIVEYTLQPNGEATTVTWAMHGPQPFLGKVMCLFFNVDKMVGADFEAGLANLKAIAER